MAQRAGRITCPRCGANNFDTVTSCWKCGAPVGAAAVAQPQAAPPPQSPAVAAPYVQERAPAPVGYAPPMAGGYGAPAPSGDTGVARRAALLLGLTIPFIGLPAGWIFMMLDDRHKQSIGRWCAMWSMIGLVIHLVLTYFVFQQAGQYLGQFAGPIISGALKRGGSSSEGMP